MSTKKSISLMRNTLVGTALFLPLFAQASETDAIGATLIILAIAVGWIIFHVLFLFRYVTKRTVTLMICLSITSLGLIITGIYMYFSNHVPPMPSNWDESALVFIFLGLVGPVAIMISKPIKKS